MKYDSRNDTHEHIKNVQKYLMQVINDLQKRLLIHDDSKLVDPEKEVKQSK